ncbi:MAG: hypothetical protein OXC28_06380 [Defluviicoccus sp.]|nr:hypothetical protein [Defluviicoccus sp.]
MTEGSDRGSCRFHDAHAARAALRGAGRQAWDTWVVCRAGEGATPALVRPEYVGLADVVVAKCPLVGDETAEIRVWALRRADPQAGGRHLPVMRWKRVRDRCVAGRPGNRSSGAIRGTNPP